ncbi:CPCC family cysteine-rich protein [Pseudomonas frederiksbergensis]|uniref:CPCC family cysteine-rich protein n=1 Tax=Pseudomonas frederiksbergensis TaxID=104087 RepID=UPI003D19CBB0
MERLHRSDAVNRLSKNRLNALNNEARESYILNWWGIDESDFEFSFLSKDMRDQLILNKDPPSDIDNCLYDELIYIALSSEYKGVTNTYLSNAMQKIGLGRYEVYGDIELLEVCPCCGFRTLPSIANYDICGLCAWEDNGVTDTETYSGPNHMTLGEAKEKFAKNMDALPLEKWNK